MRMNIRKRETIDGYLFILPAMAFFSIFMLYPFGYSFWLSLHEKTGIKLTDIEFTGITQYIRAILDPAFSNSLVNTIVYTASVVFFQVAIGLVLAVLLNRPIIGQTLFRSAIFTPVVLSTIVCGIIWTWLYSPDISGLINRFLSVFGIQPIAWLRDPNWAMFAVIFMSIWKWIGYFMVIYIAALQDIPVDYYEAANLEGAGSIQQFRYISFPLLANTTWLLVITAIINSFQIFDQIFTMTKGGPLNATDVLVYFIYRQGFVSFDLPYASAIAWLMFGVIFLLTLFQVKLQSRHE